MSTDTVLIEHDEATKFDAVTVENDCDEMPPPLPPAEPDEHIKGEESIMDDSPEDMTIIDLKTHQDCVTPTLMLNDPQSLLACLKQLQEQQHKQTLLISAMQDTINDLTATLRILRDEVDELKRNDVHGTMKHTSAQYSKALSNTPASIARGTPVPGLVKHHAAIIEAQTLLSVGESQDTTDEEIDAIIQDKKMGLSGLWPTHRLKKWIEEIDLQKIRLHRSEKYSHVPVRIPRTDKNKEGRLICKLCSGGKCNRNTTWMCSTCEVPLCVDTLEGDSTQSHHVRWHQCIDLREENERCNVMLKSRRDSNKRTIEEVYVGGINNSDLVEDSQNKRERLQLEEGYVADYTGNAAVI